MFQTERGFNYSRSVSFPKGEIQQSRRLSARQPPEVFQTVTKTLKTPLAFLFFVDIIYF